jgi:hypothetical protein
MSGQGWLKGREVELEDLARTAACPQCGSEPGHKCVYEALPNLSSKVPLGPLPQTVSHLGRLRAAGGDVR